MVDQRGHFPLSSVGSSIRISAASSVKSAGRVFVGLAGSSFSRFRLSFLPFFATIRQEVGQVRPRHIPNSFFFFAWPHYVGISLLAGSGKFYVYAKSHDGPTRTLLVVENGLYIRISATTSVKFPGVNSQWRFS